MHTLAWFGALAKLLENVFSLAISLTDWTQTMKTANTQLAGALVGLGGTITQAMNEIEDFIPCGHPASVVIDGLAALEADLPDDVLAERIESVRGFIQHVSEHRGVPAHDVADMSALSGSRKELFDHIEKIARKLKPKGGLHQNVNAWLYRSLAAIEGTTEDVAAQLAQANVIAAVVEQI